MLSFLSKVHVIKDICNRSKDEKIAFCKQVLQNDLLGFKFNFQNYENPTCTGQTFDLAFIRDEETINRKIPMYSCPKIEYRDIETGKRSFVEYRFHVSRGENRKTAIMFFRKVMQDEKFPLYFVSRISFSKLTPNKEPDASTSLPRSRRLDTDEALESTKNFLEAKQLSERKSTSSF